MGLQWTVRYVSGFHAALVKKKDRASAFALLNQLLQVNSEKKSMGSSEMVFNVTNLIWKIKDA